MKNIDKNLEITENISSKRILDIKIKDKIRKINRFI
jgi:hypothetical protein